MWGHLSIWLLLTFPCRVMGADVCLQGSLGEGWGPPWQLTYKENILHACNHIWWQLCVFRSESVQLQLHFAVCGDRCHCFWHTDSLHLLSTTTKTHWELKRLPNHPYTKKGSKQRGTTKIKYNKKHLESFFSNITQGPVNESCRLLIGCHSMSSSLKSSLRCFPCRCFFFSARSWQAHHQNVTICYLWKPSFLSTLAHRWMDRQTIDTENIPSLAKGNLG